MTKALFIIDFDLTISQEHVHHLVASLIAAGRVNINDTETQWQYVKNVPPTGSPQKWENLFDTLLDTGHDVAIASFCDFKPMIERYLREIIGLDESAMEKIFIESWLPENPNSADKSKHIENVIKHFNYEGKPEFIILVDDSKINGSSARAQKHTVVEVVPGDKTGKHIDTILTLSKQCSKK